MGAGPSDAWPWGAMPLLGGAKGLEEAASACRGDRAVLAGGPPGGAGGPPGSPAEPQRCSVLSEASMLQREGFKARATPRMRESSSHRCAEIQQEHKAASTTTRGHCQLQKSTLLNSHLLRICQQLRVSAEVMPPAGNSTSTCANLLSPRHDNNA